MHARITTLTLDPARIDDATAQLESEDLPMWKELDGFKGFTLLADRSSGQVRGVSYWESEGAMDASEERVQESRRRALETGGGGGEPQVERYEVLLDVEV